MAAVTRHRLAALVVCLLAVAAPSRAAQASSDSAKPVVWVLATGGTIAGRGASPTDLSNYSSGSITGADLVAAVPALAQVAQVKTEQIANVGSSDLNTGHWLTLAKRLNALLADPGVSGAVVTHGTDTLEETAYFLHLTVKSPKPVVVVGSMRPATAISADGPLNLLNAVRTAVSADAVGKGVLVVLNDEIMSARDATKTNTYRVETFKGGELGLLGYVDEDRVSIYHTTTRRHTTRSEFDVQGLNALPKVDVLYTYLEPEPGLLKAVVAAGAQGVVFAGVGAGNLSKAVTDAIGALRAGGGPTQPVLVRTSRVGNGRVIANREVERLSLVPGDNLNAQKARILLMLALARTKDPKDIARMFSEY